MRADTKSKIEVCALMAALALFMAATVYGFYKTEYSKKPVLKEKVESNNVSYLYDFYVGGKPNIENREYYGSPGAEIIVIAFLSPVSESSRHFMSSIFPQLKKEYIDNGKIKFYSKSHLTSEDFSAKNEDFMVSASLSCVRAINRQQYYQFYFDIFTLSPGNKTAEIQKLAAKRRMPMKEFNKCMQSGDFKDVMEDLSEVENLGMVGASPRFYIGLEGSNDMAVLDGTQKYDKFKKAIREYEIIKGD